MIHYKNISQILTLERALEKDGRNLTPDDLDIITDGSIICDQESILWVGKTIHAPIEKFKINKTHNLTGISVTPEIVDSHTHLVFGGNRANEYVMRLNGATYEEIAQTGGGILSTVKATNELSDDQLFELGLERIEKMHQLGIGTIEIKSGYALNYQDEKRLSLVIHRLKEHFSPRVQIINTFMAAHAVPNDYKSSTDYTNNVVLPLLEELAKDKIIDGVDLFLEEGYFEENDFRLIAEATHQHGLLLKVHADEFVDGNGAGLACELGAFSADHLISINDKNIQLMAKSKTVATLLPGTSLFLGKPYAPGKKMLGAGVKVAIASDYNPGSCHFYNLPLIASMSAKVYQLNITQFWAAITLNSAHALNLKHQGVIKEGFKPRFSFFKCQDINEVTYSWGENLAFQL